MDKELTYEKEVKYYYSNIVGIDLSAYDLKMNFGMITNDKQNLDEVIQAQVIMSPQHAKALLGLLAENISRYEETFGTINIDPLKR